MFVSANPCEIDYRTVAKKISLGYRNEMQVVYQIPPDKINDEDTIYECLMKENRNSKVAIALRNEQGEAQAVGGCSATGMLWLVTIKGIPTKELRAWIKKGYSIIQLLAKKVEGKNLFCLSDNRNIGSHIWYETVGLHKTDIEMDLYYAGKAYKFTKYKYIPLAEPTAE